MAATSTTLTTKVTNGSPYQLSQEQTLKASNALLKHIKATEKADADSKPNLLSGGEEEDDESVAIWLQLTTKKHITDTKRLKPGKITVPHPLNTSSTTTICLITADPQRTYKDLIASPAFPSALAARITRVVGIGKIKTKWTQYEAQRKLYSEHDIFLADDRIITQLPRLLGKTFYQKATKRPAPVNLSPPAPRTDGKRIARAKDAGPQAATPQQAAIEIEKAIHGALVHLTPSTNTAVKIGYASWDADKLTANIDAVATAMIDRYVPKKWRGVKSMHIKSATTAALPIWLADELWVDETDVLDEETARELAEKNAANTGKKRKAIEGGADEGRKKRRASAAETETKEKDSKVKEGKKLLPSNYDTLDKEIALRKERLKKQKAAAAMDVPDDVPKATKKSKKAKA